MSHVIRTLTVTAILLATMFARPAAGDDWPQWRGPKRDGISTEPNLLKTWPTNGPPVLWMTKGLGAGYSSVSVVGSRIFTMGDRGDSSYVIALNAAEKGKTLWAARVGKPAGGGGYAGPRSTPTVSGAHVYALGQHGDLVCVQAADGKEVWHKNLKDDFGGKMMSGWGYSESLLVDGENVICTPGGPDGTLAALDKRTGNVVWRSRLLTDSAAYSSIITAEIGGVKQYIQITKDSVAGIAPDSGKVLWRVERSGSTAVIPTPIYKDGHVFVTSGYGVGCNLFRIAGDDGKFSASQVYANKDLANHHGGVIQIGDHVYGHSDGKGWVCMELKTGNLVWNKSGVGKGSVVAVDGKLICRGEGRGQNKASSIALIEASPAGYKELGRFEQPERSLKEAWPHPVVADGRLYIRDMDVLLCYDLREK